MKAIFKGKGGHTLILVVPPLLATFVLWLTRLNDITLFEFLAASGLLAAAWVPYYLWREAGERYMPLFPMLSFMFWTYYVLGLFWGNRAGYGLRETVSDESIEQSMLLAAMGVTCLWVGKWIGVGRRLVSRKVIDIHLDRENTWSYVRTALAISIPLMFTLQTQAYLFGTGGRQLFMILVSTVPMAVFVLLLRKLLSHKANHSEVLLIGVFLISRFVVGIASGWLGTGVALMITCTIAYLYEQRKIPKSAIVLVLAYILFFQAGKEAFRRTFWGERVDATLSQRISFWSSESFRNWQLTLESPNSDNWHRLANQTLGRLSLLQQTANVIDMTPRVVPFQRGRLYSYMLVTLVPRAVWDDKPSVNVANRFYQVAYGVTDSEHLDSVAIAVGTVAESFINFGWWGPLLVMIPLGIFFDYFQHAFLARDSGWVLNAIGIALIPNFLMVESQLAQYLAGILQSIAVVFLILWPVLHVRSRGKSANQPNLRQHIAGTLRPPAPALRRFL